MLKKMKMKMFCCKMLIEKIALLAEKIIKKNMSQFPLRYPLTLDVLQAMTGNA